MIKIPIALYINVIIYVIWHGIGMFSICVPMTMKAVYKIKEYTKIGNTFFESLFFWLSWCFLSGFRRIPNLAS